MKWTKRKLLDTEWGTFDLKSMSDEDADEAIAFATGKKPKVVIERMVDVHCIFMGNKGINEDGFLLADRDTRRVARKLCKTMGWKIVKRKDGK